MVTRRFRRFASVVGWTLITGAATAGEPKTQIGPRKPFVATSAVAASSATSAQPKLLDFVAESHRDAVAAIIKSPTLAAKATDDEFVAHPKVYDFLLAHPDRTALAWQRLKVPCVEITDLGKGQFFWTDPAGSELTWQTVGTFENGVVWYAVGKVKAGPLVPTVPVKAVAVLQSPHTPPDAAESSTYKPVVNVYIQCDSKLAAAALRLAGPSAPRMAEEGAEQLLFFFSGVARYLHKKPDQIEPLLGPKKK
jgi:hypothetical protein